jgi:hypothetical protein
VQLAHDEGEQNDVPKKEVSLLVEHAVPKLIALAISLKASADG